MQYRGPAQDNSARSMLFDFMRRALADEPKFAHTKRDLNPTIKWINAYIRLTKTL